MSDQLLTTLKIALLGLLYLFFARVLWAVWTEVRVPTSPGLTRNRAKKSKSPVVNGATSTTPTKLLMVEPASMRGRTLVLEDGFLVGRSVECNVSLADDPFVSTKHARFFRRGDNWFVEDMGSTNGTLLNAVRITEAQGLRIDDRVQTGGAVFEIS